MSEEPDLDPIVEEVRKAREEYAARFDFDLDAIITDLQRRTEARRLSGYPVIPAPPPPVKPPAQKAG